MSYRERAQRVSQQVDLLFLIRSAVQYLPRRTNEVDLVPMRVLAEQDL